MRWPPQVTASLSYQSKATLLHEETAPKGPIGFGRYEKRRLHPSSSPRLGRSPVSGGPGALRVAGAASWSVQRECTTCLAGPSLMSAPAYAGEAFWPRT
jgi:hypothetical protein